jgi:uncharacterized lipoprotein
MAFQNWPFQRLFIKTITIPIIKKMQSNRYLKSLDTGFNQSVSQTSTKLSSRATLRLVRSCVGLLVCSVFLAGCARDKAIVSEDNSIDYRSAVSLPPLIKTLPSTTSVDNAAASTSVAVSQAEDQSAPGASAQEEADTTSRYESANVVAEPLAAELVSEPVSDQDEVRANSIAASIINTRDNTSRLQVEAPLNTAWTFVLAQARVAGMSIFSRNVADSRMFIGCANIPKTSTSKKSGRWTFFNRDKKADAAQYCSLILRKDGARTQVSVLDTNGSEVDSEYAEPILARLGG